MVFTGWSSAITQGMWPEEGMPRPPPPEEKDLGPNHTTRL